MADSASHWHLLTKAAARVEQDEFVKYFELRRLLASRAPRDRRLFEREFATYYRLGIGGLTPAFKRRYFDLLFACAPKGQDDPYTSLLLELYEIPRRKGDHTIQASFVSKLVSIHDESRPIFDRHVSNFFGLSVPGVGTTEFRVAGFVSNLRRVQAHYEEWAAEGRFREIKAPLLRKQPLMKTCHSSRLCDFLVWTVGAHKLN